MSQLTVISPPVEEPVSLTTAKEFLRIGHSGEDQLVSELIESARARLEQASRFALVRRTVRLVWSQWPAEIAGRGVRLGITPVESITSVVLSDSDDTSQEITDRVFLDCGRLRLRAWNMLPSVKRTQRIEATLQAGFGTAEQVPPDLREAILRLIAAGYNSRQVDTRANAFRGDLPEDVQAILDARQGVRL